MRTINRNVKYKGKTYKNAYSSTYSDRYKWRIILPEQVVDKLDDCIENKPPDFPFNREVALYFLSEVSRVAAKKKDKYYIGGYVNLNAEILKEKHSNSKKYFKYFVDNGILQENPKYKPNEFSKSYRYNYEELGLLTFKIFEIAELEARFHNKILTSETTIQWGNSYLTKWLNDKLTIDIDEVFREIQEKTKHTKIQKQKTLKKVECYLQSLKNLQFHTFWAKRKERDNRLHTNLTNMPSFFRKHINYDFEPLSGVDIKNSQPFFLIIFLEELIKLAVFDRNREELEENRKIKVIRKVYSNIGTMLQVLSKTLTSREFQEEYLEMKSNILGGTFYESLDPHFQFSKNKKGEYCRKFYDKDSKKTRKYSFEVKRDMMKKLVLFFLYKSNKEKEGDIDYLKFKDLYPNFCTVLEVLKSDNNKLLPKVLQYLEADCVLDFTCKEIAKQYPKIPLFTIHDSIITTESNYDIVDKEVRRLITEYCNGIEPTLKKDVWCEGCSLDLVA